MSTAKLKINRPSKKLQNLALALGLVAGIAVGLSIPSSFAQSAAGAKKDDYDRLDGTGKSGKRVDVIEWQGNLEIHVYPKGSIAGLAFKLDKRKKEKPVLVIGYRFDNQSTTQLIRRAILGIPLNEHFKVFEDKDTKEYDKVVISNRDLSSQYASFGKRDKEPTRLYPEGHPANQVAEEGGSPNKGSETRNPASAQPASNTYQSQNQQSQNSYRQERAQQRAQPAPEKKESFDKNSGAIKFGW